MSEDKGKGFGEFLALMGITPGIVFVLFLAIAATGALVGLGIKMLDRPQTMEPVASKIKPKSKTAVVYEDAAKIRPAISPAEIETAPKALTLNRPVPVPTVIRPTTTLKSTHPFVENSVDVIPAPKPPIIAIIIDDMGIDMIMTQRALKIDAPLTLSYLTYAPQLQNQIRQARDRGFEVMLHIPMEASGGSFDYGGPYLTTAKDAATNVRILSDKLDRASGYIGINNHMGSAFTVDATRMDAVLAELSRRGLAFVDSRTAAKSRHRASATAAGVPFAERDVFLDDLSDPAAIAEQIRLLEKLARRRGFALALAHPRRNTLDALEAWLPTLADKGITLVPVSYLISQTNR